MASWTNKLICFLLLGTLSSMAWGNLKTVVSKWAPSKNTTKVVVNFLEHLPAEQIEILKSGFSTFTRISVQLPVGADYMQTANVDCTVVYDTWDEEFEIVQLSPSQRVRKVKNIKAYSELCLSFSLPNTPFLQRMIKSNQKLPATILIEQISMRQSENIRSWLVQQQSPLIQNLFSHMLGNIKVEEKLKFAVVLPQASSKAP